MAEALSLSFEEPEAASESNVNAIPDNVHQIFHY
jgi:hypothetical protein